MIFETASAKINLYLHVGPRRVDGLHELASLFVFAEKGDIISVEAAADLSLGIEGPFAAGLKDLSPQKNIVWHAAARLKQAAGVRQGAAVTLQKNLPVAAGIGGGSADAAAALRALVRLWRLDIADDVLTHIAFELGADVPACLQRAPITVAGAGEQIEKGPSLPPLWVCLVNPGVVMPTGPIFRAFDEASPAPLAPASVSLPVHSYSALCAALRETRNDLEPYAKARAPEIGRMLAFLDGRPGALLSRMSGSGATCFALFASATAAARAQISTRAEGWWALASQLCMR